MPRPPTAAFLQQKHWVVSFDRAWPIIGIKTVSIHELGPSDIVRGDIVRGNIGRSDIRSGRGFDHSELPGNVTDQFAAVGITRESTFFVNERSGGDVVTIAVLIVFKHRKKEFPFRIPQFLHRGLSQRIGKRFVLLCRFDLPQALCHLSNGLGISPHISVEAWAITRCTAQDILRLTASDVELHSIVMSRLPEQPDRRIIMPSFPSLVVLDEFRQQAFDEFWIWVDRIESQYAVG